MAAVRKPKFFIQYNGKDITADLTESLISTSFTDTVIGKSDEMQFTVEDADQLWRNEWYPAKGDRVHLQMGYDDLIVDCGDFEIDEVEANGSRGTGDTFTVKGLATWVSTALRTKNSGSFENQTLRQIVGEIAKKNGLTVDDGSTVRIGGSRKVKTDITKEKDDLIYEATLLRSATSGSEGTQGGALQGSSNVARMIATSLQNKGYTTEPVELFEQALIMQVVAAEGGVVERVFTMNQSADLFDKISKSLVPTAQTVSNANAYNGALYTIRLVRSTQNNETDLEYLNRLGEEYGFIFTVVGTKLVAQSIFDIEAGNPVLVIDASQLLEHSIKDKTSLSYKDCTVTSHNPIQRKTPSYTMKDVKNGDGIDFTEASTADTLVIKTRSENQQQAEQKAKVALYKSKTQQLEGNIKVEGHPLLVAGNNFELTGMGQMSGKYHIMTSTHTDDKGDGYTTGLEIKRVGYVALVKNKTARKKKPQNYHVEVIR